MANPLDGVAVLEAKKADLLGMKHAVPENRKPGRLDPTVRQAHIDGKVAALQTKFQTEYKLPAPKDMVQGTIASESDAFDVAVWADLDALKMTSAAVVTSLAAGIAKHEDLPDAVTEAQTGRSTPLTVAESATLQLLEQVQWQNLRAELAGAGFDRWLDTWRDAITRNDRATLRYIERQRAQGWPTVTRDQAMLEQQQELDTLITSTRAARVPADLREAHTRAVKVWDATLDGLHRTIRRQRLTVAR